MKNMTLALLCCSVLMYACDNTSDTSRDAADKTTGLDSALESAKNTATRLADIAKNSSNDAVQAAKEAASDAVASGQDLTDTAVDRASAAVESAKKSMDEAVDDTVKVTKDISSAVVEKSGAVIAAVTGSESAQGESIYKKHCIACHGAGVAGSPKLGDKAAWSTRIAQGEAVLTQHAIQGFKGDSGYMPPKGGFMNLSDADIAATVKYMVSQAQ